jgi:predicted phage tail component-like protein
MAKFGATTFDGVPIPNFVKIRNISHTILPPVQQTLLTINGRPGAYDFGNQIGTREIEIDIMIIASEKNIMPSLLSELSSWLYHDEPKELVLGDNPTKYYLAKFTGDSQIGEELNLGRGTLRFICTDPYIYHPTRSLLIPYPYGGEELELVNTGNTDTFPTMKFEFTKNVSAFSVVSGDEFIDLGSPYDISSQTPVDASPYILRDQLTTTTGWTTAPSVTSGSVYGSFEVYGSHCFRQANLDYGTATGWKGASTIKALSNAAKEFEAKFFFRLDSKIASMGRVQFYLQDVNGSNIFLLQMHDAWAGSKKIDHVAYAINSSGASTKISSKSFGSNISSFIGMMRLRRIKNVLYIDVYLRDSNKKYKLVHSTKYGVKNSDWLRDIKQVQIAVGAYSSYEPAYMELWDVVVVKKDATVNEETEVPYIFQAGDTLEINNKTGAILKNGLPFYEYLNPNSTFIKLGKGSNGIVISPNDCFQNGEIIYQERTL